MIIQERRILAMKIPTCPVETPFFVAFVVVHFPETDGMPTLLFSVMSRPSRDSVRKPG